MLEHGSHGSHCTLTGSVTEIIKHAQTLLSLAGRINGKLRVQSNDVDSWRFPVIKGRLRGNDLGFHFFDAPDDFSKTKLDLLFEGDRLYMHGAQGFFGAVPMTLTGVYIAWELQVSPCYLAARCIPHVLSEPSQHVRCLPTA